MRNLFFYHLVFCYIKAFLIWFDDYSTSIEWMDPLLPIFPMGIHFGPVLLGPENGTYSSEEPLPTNDVFEYPFIFKRYQIS